MTDFFLLAMGVFAAFVLCRVMTSRWSRDGDGDHPDTHPDSDV